MKNLTQFINESIIGKKDNSLKSKNILSKFKKITMDNIDDMNNILDECADDLDCIEAYTVEEDLQKIFINICKNNHIKYNKEYLDECVVCIGNKVGDLFWEVAWYRKGKEENCEDEDYAEQLSNDVEFFIQQWFNKIVEKIPSVFI